MRKSFGKSFMITAFLICVSLTCAADPIEYAYKQAREYESALNEKAETCHSKKEVSASAVRDRLPALPKRTLARAIGYLVYRNFVNCVYTEESRLLYSLHTLEQMLENENDKEHPEAAEYAVTRKHALGNPRLIKLEAEYMALPEKVRKQLEVINEFKTIGHPAKLLKELGLLKDQKAQSPGRN